MPPPTIMIQYANVERLIGYFRQHQVKVAALQSRLESHLDVLGRGGWQSSAATKFYADCIPVLEGVGRLSSALGSGAETLERIAELFLEAEREGSDAIPTPPGFIAISAKVDSASKVTGDVQQAVEPAPTAPPEPNPAGTPAATSTPDSGVPAQTPTVTPAQTPPGPSTPTEEPAQPPSEQEQPFRYPYRPSSGAGGSPGGEVGAYGFGAAMSEMLPYAYEMAMADGPLPVGDAGGAVLMLGALATDILMVLGLLSAMPPPSQDTGAAGQNDEAGTDAEQAEPAGGVEGQQSPGYTDGSGYRTDPDTGARVLDPQNLPANPDGLLEHGWVETTHPNARQAGHRTFTDPATGNRVRFDTGREGEPGYEGRDHYHVHNPNSQLGNADSYLDRDGNSARRHSDESHIIPERDPQ